MGRRTFKHDHRPGFRSPPSPRSLTIELEFDWQDGVRFSGYEVSHKVSSADEPIVENERLAGVVGPDSNTLVIIDENGSRQCTMVSADCMTCVYQHNIPGRAVVAHGEWTRQSE